MSGDYELTPLSNVAFTGVVAEEINRLNRIMKEMRNVGNDMADWIEANRMCQCRRNWHCSKCSLLQIWNDVSNGDR